MKIPQTTPNRQKWYRFVAAGALLAILLWLHWRSAQSVIKTHSYELKPYNVAKWQAFGGNWSMRDGIAQNHSNERGAKLLTGSDYWHDYTVTSDVRFDVSSADMGVIVRSNDESRGVDAFDGYYVGLRSLDETLVIGRANYGWVEARPVPMPGGVHPGDWYRLKVTAYGCKIAASAQNLRTHETAWVAFEERDCIKAGRLGLRSLNAGDWRNLNVAPAGVADYRALQAHADSVEQPVVLNGPSWWTPFHVGFVFAGIISLALLIQFSYFRLRRWKMYTIMQERERLAHDIHDTMAQSFAGVGYQIQGIRSSFVRGDSDDLKQIPDQLQVASEFVRRCREDARTTYAMLAAAHPGTRKDLLGELKLTAQSIAGRGVDIMTELHGEVVILDLRIVDALLHIGKEAIANAISHSALTLLKIILSFREGSVELVIEDNGAGFEYASASEGFGIAGMRKRARAVSGSIEIVSNPGCGTRVRVFVASNQRRSRWRILTRHQTGFE